MERPAVPDIDFVAGVGKKRKRPVTSLGEPTATATIPTPVVTSQTQPQAQRKQLDRHKGKEVERSATKRKQSIGGDKDSDSEIFCPVFHNYKLKQAVKDSDSVNADNSFGHALLSGICLPKDVELLPKTRNSLLSELMANIALGGQATVVCCEKIAEDDDASARRQVELNNEHTQALQGVQQQLNNLQKMYEEESARKATAEGDCAKALRALEIARKEHEDYEAGERDRMKAFDVQAYTDGMNAAIEKQSGKVEEAKAKFQKQGMEQGFMLRVRQTLVAAAVPEDSPLWNLSAVPEFVDPDAEAFETQAGGDEDGTGVEFTSQPSSTPVTKQPVVNPDNVVEV